MTTFSPSVYHATLPEIRSTELGLRPRNMKTHSKNKKCHVDVMLTDDELDEYVTSLLKNQAEKQAAAYSKVGFRAFLKNAEKEGPVGKPNTRFLKISSGKLMDTMLLLLGRRTRRVEND